MAGGAVRIVEWYRLDHGRRMQRILITGPGVLTLGAMLIALSLTGRHGADLRMAAVLGGLALVASGAAFTAASMYWTLRQDAYIALRTDGLALHSGSSSGQPSGQEETFIPWDALAQASWDSARAVVRLEQVDGRVVVVARPYAGITLPNLAQRIEQTRRRAAMGLLR
jgi:hypothetical protein